MKKIIFLFLIGICCISDVRAQFRWGVEAGLNLSSLTSKASGYARNSAVVGVNGKYGLNDRWKLQTALLFSVKGVNGMENRPEGNDSPLLDIRLYYLEIPLMVVYKIPLATHVSILPQAGVYLACGVGGKVSTRQNVGVGYLVNDWNPFEDTDKSNGYSFHAFDRMDAGLRFGLSTEVYKFNLSVNYDLGLCGVHGTLNLPDNVHTRNTAITLGYTF